MPLMCIESDPSSVGRQEFPLCTRRELRWQPEVLGRLLSPAFRCNPQSPSMAFVAAARGDLRPSLSMVPTVPMDCEALSGNNSGQLHHSAQQPRPFICPGRHAHTSRGVGPIQFCAGRQSGSLTTGLQQLGPRPIYTYRSVCARLQELVVGVVLILANCSNLLTIRVNCASWAIRHLSHNRHTRVLTQLPHHPQLLRRIVIIVNMHEWYATLHALLVHLRHRLKLTHLPLELLTNRACTKGWPAQH
eukprot:2664736-Amphidinium_carterae.1